MKQIVIWIAVVIGAAVIVVGSVWVYRVYFTESSKMLPISKDPGQVACPALAKACPDGSYVSPSGPKCEFAPCPSVPTTYESIRVEMPRPNDVVSGSIRVVGQARGAWFFEGGFPVSLRLSDGRVIAGATAEAKGDWMTAEFVPFEAVLVFPMPAGITSGSLLLSKDNPSGLPENDMKISIPVKF